MARFINFLLGLGSLLGSIGYAFHMSTNNYTKSFWEYYPLLVSGALLALVFFFAASRNK